MASPRILTRLMPSENVMAPVKMSAVSSPTEKPATAMQFSTADLFYNYATIGQKNRSSQRVEHQYQKGQLVKVS